MSQLPTELRNKLERTIVAARDVAEVGARAALEALAVHHHEPYRHMSSEERWLRNHLRARARQLGDKQDKKGQLEITHLVWECAYEHWHRMLFARFLAENDLLIERETGVAISLEECEELAKEEGKDPWTLASEFAQHMVPQIFRPDDPVLKITFASEHRLKLKRLLEDLEPAVFSASDSLGWVYQFWQSKQKAEIYSSQVKISADELPTVTQIFTEPYMVEFLLHNTLGAWWVAKHNKETLPIEMDFLLLGDDDSPAAGSFEGWPATASELRILDPCCGSGHFLVSAFNILVHFRMREEGLSANEACNLVLSANIQGLEIDERCTQIAVFALALAAWKFPGAGGYRIIPTPKIACSGLRVSAKKEYWMKLADGDARLEQGMERMYRLYNRASTFGSLIEVKMEGEPSLFEAGYDEIEPLFNKILNKEDGGNRDGREICLAAQGIAAASKLLEGTYHLVVTNVPFLARGKQGDDLREFCESRFPLSKADLATVFLERCLRFCTNGGSLAIVTPELWLSLTSYKALRIQLLPNTTWNILAKLGPAAFHQMNWWAARTILLILTREVPGSKHQMIGIELPYTKVTEEKPILLRKSKIHRLFQRMQFENPDARIRLVEHTEKELLANHADVYAGIQTGDNFRFTRFFFEIDLGNSDWEKQLRTVNEPILYGGREQVLLWQEGKGLLMEEPGAVIRGSKAFGKHGVCVNRTASLSPTLYCGELFDQNGAVVIPKDPNLLAAIWAFLSSREYSIAVRELDTKTGVTPSTLIKVPFSIDRWQKVAKEIGPIPKAYSEDPTQWIFTGKILPSAAPLQVSVARLLAYCWPDQEQDELDVLADSEGIVCIPAVRGEDPATERLRTLVAVAYGDRWSPEKEMELIGSTGSRASDFGQWLRNDFFEQHCKLFYHRPFIWHIWDGRTRDGFHALVNYHKLAEGNGRGRQLLESLTYSYLGDWITRQKDGVRQGEGGAEDRLAAALELQNRLISILEGEPPFDIFVRWKPIDEQPIGWELDINDGVRLNIRPFMAHDIPGGRKGAGILRWKPNIKWNKDRGKQPHRSKEQYPWFWENGEFTGDRVNDVYLTNEEKLRAREKAKEKRGQ